MGLTVGRLLPPRPVSLSLEGLFPHTLCYNGKAAALRVEDTNSWMYRNRGWICLVTRLSPSLNAIDFPAVEFVHVVL